MHTIGLFLGRKTKFRAPPIFKSRRPLSDRGEKIFQATFFKGEDSKNKNLKKWPVKNLTSIHGPGRFCGVGCESSCI